MKFSNQVIRAIARPRAALRSARRWAAVARHAGIPYVDVAKYRSELRRTPVVDAHRARGEVAYSFPEAAEVYVVVRALKPRLAVETGVASGFSSAHILHAMARNGEGQLHSMDLPNVQRGSTLPPGRDTGWIVPDALRTRWRLLLGDARELLPALLDSLGPIDLFLHDSDHSYEHMSFEFEVAYAHLAEGGVIVSDDTHLHSAWDDFCARHGLSPARVGHLGITRKLRTR